MSIVLQVSDTHFGTEQPYVVEALVKLAQQQRPELLVLATRATSGVQGGSRLCGSHWSAPTGHSRKP